MKYKYHYTYRISNILIKKHYYGTRSSNLNPLDDLGVKYFSSSYDKEFIKDQKLNPQNYKYKVIKTFKTRKEATGLEIKLHNKFNVGVNEKFYNRAKQTSTGFDITGTVGVNKGKLRSEKSKKKQSDTMKGKGNHRYGKTQSNESKIKQSASMKNRYLGSKNPNAKCITIFDSLDNIILVSHGNFINECTKLNLPFRIFIKSYQNNGAKLYIKKGYRDPKYPKYKGWYALRD